MSKLKTFLYLLKNKKQQISPSIADNFSRMSISRIIPDKTYLSLIYRLYFKTKLDLNCPKTFNQKLQWLKLYDRNPIYVGMVDKYEAKKYVQERIGEEHIIPTLAIVDGWNSIDISKLPDSFVIKCTHDSGSTIVCHDKTNFDFDSARIKIERSLQRNMYYFGREWPYKDVKPRIIVEECLEGGRDLFDYKFFCFNGKVKCFKIDFDRFINHKANYYSRNGELLPIGEVACPPDFSKELQVPSCIDKMIELAELLSQGTTFLRVDFYYTNNKIMFGEMTFFPASGFGPFTNVKWDNMLGDWMILPIR